MEKRKCKIMINEFLFVMIIFYHNFIRIPLYYLPKFKYVIMISIPVILMLISLINQFSNEKKFTVSKKFGIITILGSLIFGIDIMFRENSETMNYFLDFILYALLPMYFFSKTVDLKKIIEYMGYFSIVFIILYCTEPFNKYRLFGGYMGYGLYCMLPAFVSTHINRKFLNKKIFIIFEIISILEILICCNRGSLLIALIAVVILDIFGKEKDLKQIVKYMLVILILFIIIFNFSTILYGVYNFMFERGFNSYSLRTFIRTLEGETNGFAHRDTIWNDAIIYFYEKPMLGHGTAAFNDYYNNYCHNLILEILTSYGLIGLSIFFIILISQIIKICKKSDYFEKNKIFCITFFIIGILPLFLSLYMVVWPYFWIIFMLGEKNEK